MITVYNNSGEEIPPFAVMEVSGRDETNNVLYVVKPTRSGQNNVLFNGPTSIKIEGFGVGQDELPLVAAYDQLTEASPVANSSLGVKAGSWYLNQYYPGFEALEDGEQGIVVVHLSSYNMVEIIRLNTGTADAYGCFDAYVQRQSPTARTWSNVGSCYAMDLQGLTAATNGSRFIGILMGYFNGRPLYNIVCSTYFSLTVEEEDGSPSYTGVDTLILNQDDGLHALLTPDGVLIFLDGATTTQKGAVDLTDQVWAGFKSTINSFVARNAIGLGRYTELLGGGAIPGIKSGDDFTLHNSAGDYMAAYMLGSGMSGNSSSAGWFVLEQLGKDTRFGVYDALGTEHLGVVDGTINPGDTVTVKGGLVTVITAGGGSGGSGGSSTTVSPKALMPGGRLTLTSGTPVTTSDVTAATVVYYTPYVHNHIPLFNGSVWTDNEFSEISPSLAALTSGKVADVFAYLSGGTVVLEAVLWTNSTTRAINISYQDGRLCKTGDKTRLYLGTIANNSARASLTVDDADLFRGVWNFYWRVERRLKVADTTDSWTSTDTAWHSLNSSTANRVSFVVGVNEIPVSLDHTTLFTHSAGGTGFVGVGLDSVTTNHAQILPQGNVDSSSDATPLMARYKDFPAVGLHFLQLLEAANPVGTTTFYGDYNGSVATSKIQGGGLGWIMA